jgi:Xaa-Pro aminopeptidase
MDYPERYFSLSHTLHRLRLYKSSEEISVLKEAARITKEGHCAAMKATKPGAFEYELEAELIYHFRKNGGSGPGYTSIVGGGSNAVILHYIENDSPLQDGDLVCVDAGCEYQWYTADVTRTWPVNGRFSEPQKKLYNAVLKAQEASIEASVVGNNFLDIHYATLRSLVESLVELEFLEGKVETLIEEEAYKAWYMHGTSHWLGLDVHDVGSYASKGSSMSLGIGMVLTIEPGLYIAPDDERVPEEFRGIGIRIEDDILVSQDGPIVLTEDIPKTVEAIEIFMGDR